LDRLETERDNLRAALEWSKTEKTGVESELRMGAALRDLWYVHGHWCEGRRYLEDALARRGNTLSAFLPKALEGLTAIAWRQGDDARAAALSQKGLDVCQRLLDKHGCAVFSLNLGIAASVHGDRGQAIALLEDSLALCHEVGDDWLKSAVFIQLGALARARRDYERAVEHYTSSLDLSRKVGDKYRTAYCLRNLGIVALYRGAFTEAAASYKESLTLSKELKSLWVTEECLEGLAGVACDERQYKRAIHLFGIAEELREKLGYAGSPNDQRAHDQRLASARMGLGDTMFTSTWAEGRAMSLEQAIEYALVDQTG